MQTIVISDETYDFITKLVEILDNQDGRGTREPYVYAVRDVKKVYGVDESSFPTNGKVWTNWEEYFETDEELVQYALDNEEIDDNFHKPSADEVAELLGFEEVSYKEVKDVKNIFFTEESAKKHIEDNDHHFDDPDISVFHLFRNDEVQQMLDVFIEIAEWGAEDDES